jgi:hypothetical protein
MEPYEQSRELYDVRSAAALFGIPHRTLLQWIKTGLVQQSVEVLGGSKKQQPPTLLSKADLVEIGRLALVRSSLPAKLFQEVSKALREMGRHPLSQGDFLLLEQRRGAPLIIEILTNTAAMELLHTQPERQLKLIPLTGDHTLESRPDDQQFLFSMTSPPDSTVHPVPLSLDPAPLSLFFDLDQFAPTEIAEIIGLLSEMYQDVGGDALIIDDLTLLDSTAIMAEV